MLLWQGFKHRWTYNNHRVNRIGNYIRNQKCDTSGVCTAVAGHTAASGSFSDTAQYESFYAQVSAPGVRFLDGSTTMEVRGVEDLPVEVSRQISVGAPASMQGRDARAFLNGFDLVAILPADGGVVDADKVEEFDLRISDATYDPTSGNLNFRIDFTFEGACKSGECRVASTKLDYALTVHYVLASGPNTAMISQPGGAFISQNGYSWDKETEIFPQDVNASATHSPPLGDVADYSTGTVGLQRVRLNLDRDHWLLEWNTHAHTTDYDPASGIMTVQRQLFFKQWQENMYGFQKRAGTASLSVNYVALAFANGCVQQTTLSGSIAYPAEAGNDSPEAIEEVPLSFKAGCGPISLPIQ